LLGILWVLVAYADGLDVGCELQTSFESDNGQVVGVCRRIVIGMDIDGLDSSQLERQRLVRAPQLPFTSLDPNVGHRKTKGFQL